MEMALTLANVAKKYKGFELRVQSLNLPKGSIMGLVGPNGAGKSTMIKAVLNLIRLDSGKITVLGYDHITREIEAKRLLGYVPEECRLYEDATARWLGRFVSRLYQDWDADFYRQLLERFRVPAGKKVKHLSKGNKMKLSLVLALAHRPRLLLLDEPTAGLDPVVRHDLLKELLEVIQEEDRAVLISSHIVGDIEKVADYVAFLQQGEIILCDEKDSILENWRRVYFRAPGGDLSPLKRQLAYWRQEGSSVQAVTSRYDEKLVRQLEGAGAENIQVSPLTLEEIMVTLSRGEI